MNWPADKLALIDLEIEIVPNAFCNCQTMLPPNQTLIVVLSTIFLGVIPIHV